MKFSSQPIPLKRCRTGCDEELPPNLNFHLLNISSSAPPQDKRSSGSTDTKIQRHTYHLPFKERPESPLLYASQEEREQQIPYSKLTRTLSSFSFQKAAAAPDLRTHTNTVHDNSVSNVVKDEYQGNFKVAVPSPEIINKIPSLFLSCRDGKCQFFPPRYSNINEILPETVYTVKDEIIHTQAVVQKEQLSFPGSVATSLKVSQDQLEQFPLDDLKTKIFCETNDPLYQMHETISLKGDYADNEMITVNKDVANDNPIIVGKSGDFERCTDEPEKHQSVKHSSDVENEFIRNKYHHDSSENKMLPSIEPMSKSCEKVSREELLLSPLNTADVSYGTVLTKDASDFSPPPISPIGYIKSPEPIRSAIRFEEHIQQCKDAMNTYNEHLKDIDKQFYKPNQNLQELETSRLESKKISIESYYDPLQKLNGDFHRAEESFHNSSKSIIDNSGENLQVSDEFSQESDESSQESGGHSYEYTEHFQDPGNCLQNLDENFLLPEDLPDCSDCSQGSIGNFLTFSPLIGIEGHDSGSKCPLSRTSESSSANSPTNINARPSKECTKVHNTGCYQISDTFHDFNLEDKSIQINSPNVLWSIEKTGKGLDSGAKLLDELRVEKDLCTLEGHDGVEAPCNMKMRESAKFRDESKTSNTGKHKLGERNSVQYVDSKLPGNETSNEGTSHFGTHLDKLVKGRNLYDNGNSKQTTQNSKPCCSSHDTKRNLITNNKKENNLMVSPIHVPCDNMNEQATLKAKTDTFCENMNTAQEHQTILEEINVSQSSKHSTLKDNITKSSVNYQCCTSLLNCKDWIVDKPVVQSFKASHCNSRLFHQSKEYTGEKCSMSHDITTEQVVPDNDSVDCNCSLGSNEHALDDYQIEEMSKLQHRSPSCSVYTWTPLVPMPYDSISQSHSLSVSEPRSVASSLVPPFNKKRPIRVGLSKHQKVKRLHTNIRK